MPPVIALQKGLDNLKGLLEEQGYKVVSMEEEATEKADAIVYTGVNEGWTGVPSITDLGDMNIGLNKGNDAILINAHGEEPGEILKLISSRLGEKR